MFILGLLNDLWKYDLDLDVWEHLSGNRSIITRADYDLGYPGGVFRHTMMIENARQYLYVLGGEGYDDTDRGMVFV